MCRQRVERKGEILAQELGETDADRDRGWGDHVLCDSIYKLESRDEARSPAREEKHV